MATSAATLGNATTNGDLNVRGSNVISAAGFNDQVRAYARAKRAQVTLTQQWARRFPGLPVGFARDDCPPRQLRVSTRRPDRVRNGRERLRLELPAGLTGGCDLDEQLLYQWAEYAHFKTTAPHLYHDRAYAVAWAKDFGDDNAEKLQSFAESLVRKVLHGPICFIKDGGGEPSAEQLQAIDLVNKMFLSQDEGDE